MALYTGTPIDQSLEYIQQLQSFVYPKETLCQRGYTVEPLSVSQLESKKKCLACKKGAAMAKSRKQRTTETIPLTNLKEPTLPDYEGLNFTVNKTGPNKENQSLSTNLIEFGPFVPKCRFHNGTVQSKYWTCCYQHVSTGGCKGSELHTSPSYAPGEFEKVWRYYPTQTQEGESSASKFRAAVAIDCEMGTSKSGRPELIRVSVVDYFTCEVLVDNLVWPNVAMLHYNTRYSGVTSGQMRVAYRQKSCFFGRDRARNEVLKFVGPKTIVVGHSANNDLDALRWIHPVIVDTFLLECDMKLARKNTENKEDQAKEKEAELPVNLSKGVEENEKPQQPTKSGEGGLSLKSLVKERCGRQIQMAGNKGHDSVEDALAARDIAHWIVGHYAMV